MADGSKSLKVGLCMYVRICAAIYVCIRNVLAVEEGSLGVGLCVLYSPMILLYFSCFFNHTDLRSCYHTFLLI